VALSEFHCTKVIAARCKKTAIARGVVILERKLCSIHAAFVVTFHVICCCQNQVRKKSKNTKYAALSSELKDIMPHALSSPHISYSKWAG